MNNRMLTLTFRFSDNVTFDIFIEFTFAMMGHILSILMIFFVVASVLIMNYVLHSLKRTTQNVTVN